ncbi:hypothetical protein LWI28_006118 [Acer negundo]|uniref:Uncharacterized protein n=1 Tax=Acer negundo TaxID=4023 RepID=A0AAD5ICD8_ACENE|nr:hypothetical protein LWI28_006118 [Acer negundo]
MFDFLFVKTETDPHPYDINSFSPFLYFSPKNLDKPPSDALHLAVQSTTAAFLSLNIKEVDCEFKGKFLGFF